MESTWLKLSKILITFAIGRNVGKFDATQTQGALELADAVAETGIAFAKSQTFLNVEKIVSRLKQTVESAYTQAVQYAAARMIGRKTRRAWGKPNRTPLTYLNSPEFAEDSVRIATWYPLSIRQIRKQGGTDTGTFFHDTGKLRGELRAMARTMVKRTGVVKVQVKDHEKDRYRVPPRLLKEVSVADLKITLMPNIYTSHLPGLKVSNVQAFDSGMRFERALGLSDEMITKLRGPVIPGQGDLYHRPLLQPAFTYWTLFRIPSVVEEALTSGIINQKLSKKGGIADYSSS